MILAQRAVLQASRPKYFNLNGYIHTFYTLSQVNKPLVNIAYQIESCQLIASATSRAESVGDRGALLAFVKVYSQDAPDHEAWSPDPEGD